MKFMIDPISGGLVYLINKAREIKFSPPEGVVANTVQTALEGLYIYLALKSDSTHNHDLVYAPLNHNHNTLYAGVNHTHSIYALKEHKHLLEEHEHEPVFMPHTHELPEHDHNDYAHRFHTHTVVPGEGDVVGPTSSVDEDIVIFDGVSGKIIKGSGRKVADFASSTAFTAHTATHAPANATNGATWGSNIVGQPSTFPPSPHLHSGYEPAGSMTQHQISYNHANFQAAYAHIHSGHDISFNAVFVSEDTTVTVTIAHALILTTSIITIEFEGEEAAILELQGRVASKGAGLAEIIVHAPNGATGTYTGNAIIH